MSTSAPSDAVATLITSGQIESVVETDFGGRLRIQGSWVTMHVAWDDDKFGFEVRGYDRPDAGFDASDACFIPFQSDLGDVLSERINNLVA